MLFQRSHKDIFRQISFLSVVALFFYATATRAEFMVQYFNTNYEELTDKIPELAEAGYGSIWLPPPTKGSGGLSVGYDLWDRFDLGSKDNRGSVRTRYGTEEELFRLIETAHRFGIRIYFDNIMNHNAFDIPGFNENTPLDVYEGFVPEDFHLRLTDEGFYRKWDNTRDWSSTWQVQNLGLADLIDIAHENPNTNFGPSEGDDHPKFSFVRQPDNPEYYLDTDLPISVTNPSTSISFNVFTFANKEPFNDTGWGSSNIGANDGKFSWDDTNGNGQHDAGETSESFDDLGLFPENPDRTEGVGDGIYNMGNPVVEDVNGLLIRAARWQLDRTNADGYRLDAVKHVPSYFFGEQNGADKDASSAGYLGQSQEQFNITRGFSDWNNHRDSVFNTEQGRDDAMMFGEHLGQPPGFGEFVDAGMRLVDNDLRSKLNGTLGSPFAGLEGLDQPGSGGFAPSVAVMHAQSHDNDFAARRELQHAMYATRAGIGLIYTDGNYQAETLGDSGGAFPRHANTNFLGQFGDGRVPNLTYIHEHFARGSQKGIWSDADFIAYERLDYSQGASNDGEAVSLLLMMNDNFASGQARSFGTSFPATGGGADAYLYQYARGGASQVGFYTYASNLSSVVVPPGGYFIFSWKNPDPAPLWPGNGLQIYQNDQEVDTVTIPRRDGPDGDPGYNPLGLPDDDPTDYTYLIDIPRVTDGDDLRFVARFDGSAENVLFKLGGADLNSQMGIGATTGELRDNAPAVSLDTFLGFEQGGFIHRQYGEKFAAVDTLRNKFGSQGAGTYSTTVGSGTVDFTVSPDHADNDFDNKSGTVASFLYHEPDTAVGGAPPGGATQQYVENADTISLWAKSNSVGAGFNMVVYYTTDGTFPEGAGGEGVGTTQTTNLSFSHNDDGGSTDWWGVADIPKPTPGATLIYKIGVYKDSDGANPISSVFPSGSSEVDTKLSMMTVFEIDDFNAETIEWYPHNDYGKKRTGLSEGMHMIQARAFLQRGSFSPIYNTLKQTFYYDAERPQAEIAFPQPGNILGGSQYGSVIRTDRTVREVWYHIADGDSSNDDVNTRVLVGNGAGFEPFTDANDNETWDEGEAFEDLNDNGVWDANLAVNWVQATEVTPTAAVGSALPREFRFDYINIPASGSATIYVIMREFSSAEFADFSLDPADAVTGHYTLLASTHTVDGPDRRMFVRFPERDMDPVDDNYVMKVYFTKEMADGFTQEELESQFTVRIGSTEESDNGIVQDTSNATINYNVTSDFHEFAWALPNLFNGDPEFLHKIVILHNADGLPELTASRIVKALPSAKPTVIFISPPIQTEQGRTFEIVFPDVPLPADIADRVYSVQVRTDDRVNEVDVSLDFGPSAATTFTPVRTNPDGESFTDENENEAYDDGEPFVDLNGNESYDAVLTPVYYAEEGNQRFWDFTWAFPLDVKAPGVYGLRAEAHIDEDDIPDNFTTRTVPVIYRELVDNGIDADSDDDGLLDDNETTDTPLPEGNVESWTNGEVHVATVAYGFSFPTQPDSDGDLLPDGLEVGWRTAISADTNTTTDTNGDGFPNFLPDLDPPFFNTLDNEGSVPDIDSASRGGDRTRLVFGSYTDPNNPDSDGDGLDDGIEDRNRNGWVDGDGAALDPADGPSLARNWPDGIMNPGETWTETDPNNPDSDGDGLSDGNGEDKDADSYITGDTNQDRTWQVGETWSETDPLNADTDGDGLPDGWEVGNGLDPLDDGTNSLRTADDGSGVARNGINADPDNDTFTNGTELANGTHPLVADTGAPPPSDRIFIGPFPDVDQITIGGVTNDRAFTDWKIDDLLVLDENEGDGTNNQGGDTYPAFDGFDTSRDIVAFYFRDGGALAQGGDGTLNFRLDFFDLVPFAEQANLDLYVVIDTGNTAVGEYALPDEIDTGTEMRWEAIVAVYSGNVGAVLVDTNVGSNTTAIGQDLSGFGVERRDQTVANGFGQAYFSSDLDAVEFSISRQALIDAGWNGLNPDSLNFQVFTTRDGTQNSPVGAGDIGGRSDIRDTIFDDFLAEDHFRAQPEISGANSVLRGWFSRGGSNDRGKRTKVASLIHGNQSIKPGNEIQLLINDGESAGYYRPLDVHAAYNETASGGDILAPFSLHTTATLASAIQWAKVDPAANKPWRDGPEFNNNVGTLAIDGVVDLVGSTYSDHILPYFPDSYHSDNISRASALLGGIYGANPSTDILWPAERVLDGSTLEQIDRVGFDATYVDQFRHLWKWFGRSSALSDDGYRINRINGLNIFAINNRADLFSIGEGDQKGPSHALRKLLGRKARSGTQDQVITWFANWESFGDSDSADAYDSNIAWLASRPWTQLVTHQQILDGEVDLSQPSDGLGDIWGTVDRGTGLTLEKTAQLFVDHATAENYDNWFFGKAGSPAFQGLESTTLEVRPGVALGDNYGQIGQSGLINDAWNALQGVSLTNASLRDIAYGTLHAAVFQTAFHNSDNNDLSQFSTGDFINPVTGSEDLAAFAREAQSQARFAAVYARVDTWANAAASDTYFDTAVATNEDIDLDGEDEYLIYNDRLFALFERIGGRMTGVWLRDIDTGEIFQVVGNFLSFSGSDTEEEDSTYRTSGFKDWFVEKADPVEDSSTQINSLYTVFAVGGGEIGWSLQDSSTHFTKKITLEPRSNRLVATYSLNPSVVDRIFLRFGLSPNLGDLLVNGQDNLTVLEEVTGEINIHNEAPNATVRAFINPLSGDVALNGAATDDDLGEFDTLNLRNQAQTQQVELVATSDAFSFELGFETGIALSFDRNADGLPDAWVEAFGLDTLGEADPTDNPDKDSLDNEAEYILGTNPTLADVFSSTVSEQPATGYSITFSTRRDRVYQVYYSHDLINWNPASGTIQGTGSSEVWTDDGSTTGGSPLNEPNGSRFYHVRVNLP